MVAVGGQGGRASRAAARLLPSPRTPEGILLNLSGYGYRFSAERGIEVGTLAEVHSLITCYSLNTHLLTAYALTYS